MIRRVWSDLPTFREVVFEPGFNVVLADTEKDSKETESTNGLGKTTLLRVVHFCLGADLARDKVLNHPDLAGVTFGLDIEVKGERFVVSRKTSTPKRVVVSTSLLNGLFFPREPVDEALSAIAVDDWKCALSEFFFPDTRTEGLDYDERRYVPSFRDIAVYLIRLGKPAYADPMLAYPNQQGATKRLTLSYMLGLNWAVQRSISEQLASRNQLKDATKALRETEVSGELESIGELEAERVTLERQLREREREMETFNVRDDYRALEADLTSVDRQIHDLVNENYSDNRLLEFYLESTEEIPEVDASRPVGILQEAGAIFSETSLRKIGEVEEFHREIYRNRRDFLQTEILRLKGLIEGRDSRIDSLSRTKQYLLGVLRDSGAIETLIALQRSHTDLNARYQVLAAQIEERKRFDLRADEITASIAADRVVLKRDLEDRREAVDEARALFAEYTQTLYGRPGLLGIDVASDGYSLSFTIDREGSDGVDQMVVFCFDLTIASMWAKQNKGFHVLMHDSSLFADVDKRQYAAALKLAAERSAQFGFQYVCCLNVGSLPVAHMGDFKLDQFLRLRLTDDTPEGRLLGRKLPPREKLAS